jgi:DMSO reductase anchor subunit
LSREIVIFGAYTGALATAVGLEVLVALGWLERNPLPCMSLFALLLGLAGVFSSAMIYAVTQRPSWNLMRSGGKFFLTTVLCASLAAAVFHSQLWIIAIGVAATKLLYEAICNWHSLDKYGRVSDFYSPLGQAARLVRGPLERLQAIRTALACASIAAMLFTAAVSLGGNNPTLALVGAGVVAVFVAAGELFERTLFFTAMSAPKMPGGVAT